MDSRHARGARPAPHNGLDGVRRQPGGHRRQQERHQGRVQCTKHVDVECYFVNETVESGRVKLQWIPTQQQEADIFTKALAAPVFLELRKKLMTG